MAEITKVTTPIIPQENVGNKYKPVSDQALDLNDLSKVNRPADEPKLQDRDTSGQALRENLHSAAMQPLLRDTLDVMQAVRKMFTVLQMGISASDIVTSDPIRQLLDEMFVPADKLFEQLQQQERSSVLFKGESFDVLRDVLARFEQNPRVREAIARLLGAFECNLNTQNSIKTILYNCENILDYLFSQDRKQFADYLDGLSEMLLPQEQKPQGEGETQQAPAASAGRPEETGPSAEAKPPEGAQADSPALPGRISAEEQREISQLLKGNLLPLLGEIVVKYHQNERIRDIVMAVVHNIVRVDKGSEEALREAVERLGDELRLVARLPESFERSLLDMLIRDGDRARLTRNEVMARIAGVISETLHSRTASPAALRQAENLLMSMLQNQSSAMDILHFLLPLQTPEGQVFAEMYVDPESDGRGGAGDEDGRKVFLSVETPDCGYFEFCFWQKGSRVDFSLWCPQVLVESLSGLRGHLAAVMQMHGFTINRYQVAEMVRPQTIAQVFPGLLERKVGVDVRI